MWRPSCTRTYPIRSNLLLTISEHCRGEGDITIYYSFLSNVWCSCWHWSKTQLFYHTSQKYFANCKLWTSVWDCGGAWGLFILDTCLWKQLLEEYDVLMTVCADASSSSCMNDVGLTSMITSNNLNKHNTTMQL